MVVRFSSITDKLFNVIEESCNSKDVSGAVAMTQAMRFLRLNASDPLPVFPVVTHVRTQVTSAKGKEGSLAFIARIRDQYFDPKSKKQLKDLQIALFELLAHALAPVIEIKVGWAGTTIHQHLN